MSLKQVIWKNLLKWWKRFAVLAAIFLLWTGICQVGLVSANTCGWVGLNAAVVLYFLALPLSIVLRLDQAALRFSQSMTFPVEIVGLVYVFLNFSLLAALGGFRKWMKAEKPAEAEKNDSVPPPPRTPPLNGTAKHDPKKS